jgi:energy-coupling factor transport system permease protein
MKGFIVMQLFSDITKGKGFLYHISGLSKLIGFLFLTFAAMFSYDVRFILFLLAFSIVLIAMNRIPLKPLKLVFIYVSVFLILNTFLTYLFEPEYGVTIYGTRNEIAILFGRYTLTQEQLLYQATKFLKYLSVIPLGVLFLYTTDPSEFASSLNGIGVPYKVSYSLALTLRYFPDLQEDYSIISKAQQARGLELSKKTSVWKRLRFAIYTIIPLIFSTLDRIDSISNAMDLRRFGQHKTRNWYSKQRLASADYLAIGVSFTVFLTSILISILINQSRFFNPFI